MPFFLPISPPSRFALASSALHVLNSETSTELRESAELLQEFLFIYANATNPHCPPDDCMTAGGISISELRNLLASVGLNVDGSREVIAHLVETLDSDGSESDFDASEEPESGDQFSFDSEDDSSDD